MIYACEPWEVDVSRRELRSRGAPVTLGNRAFQIVEVLAQARGRLVAKDDLMDRIWPGAIVGENTLQVHISAVRKALGSDRDLLKTSHGRGYRLAGDWTVQDGEAIEPPPLPPSRSPHEEYSRTNLPAGISELVGRSAAIQRVRDLASAYRVVTLTGPGGIGKTVLAMKAASDLLADFQDGAWLVELASLSDTALAPSAVAGTLKLTPGDRVTAESLARAIGDRHLLLVLDNCEHLIDAVAILVEILMRLCPHTTVLLTSREILRIQGETVFRVPALDVPAPGQQALDSVLGHSAVELFVTRAKALDTGFSPRLEDLPSITEICRHLDGIPLAIEFAAARAAFVGTEQVATGLRDRFALLTSGRRTAVPRHRTLRAALDWSYQLLSREEQDLLCRLAIFPAGFSFEAAQAVGGMGHADPVIVEELSSLVSKSLCERVNSTLPTRWRLLETIRAYALGKLHEKGEYSEVARRHAEYYRDLIRPVAASSAAWLDRDDVARCGRELDNVRAALDWAFSPGGDNEIGASLTVAFAPIWQSLSILGECRDRIECMLATRPPTAVPEPGEWRMWVTYSHALAMTLRPIDGSRAAIKRAMELAAGNEDPDLQAGLLHVQWSVEFTSGAHRAALIAARRLVEVTSQSGDAMRLAGERILGSSLLFAGELTEAQDLLQRVVDFYVAPSAGHHSTLFRRDPQMLGRARLARALALRGFLDRAYAEALSCFDRAQASGVGITVCWVVNDALCPIALMRGDLGTAARAIAAMSDWATRLDAALWKAMAACWKGRLALERGEFAKGIELLSPTLEASGRSGWQMGYVEFLACLAEGLADCGRLDEAHSTLGRAIASAGRNGEEWYRAELKRLEGELLLRRSDEAAENRFREAMTIAREQGALSLELRAALGLAKLRLAQHPSEEVKPILTSIYDRFTEGFDTPDLRSARTLLDGTQDLSR